MIYLFTILQVFGSAETGVPSICKKITLETEEAGYTFTVEVDSKRNLKRISGMWDSKAFSIPPEELKGVSEAVLENTMVMVDSSMPQGKQKGVHLTLVYGYTEQFNSQKKRRVLVPNIIKLYFESGKYLFWEKSESAGDNTGKWHFTLKELGKKEESQGDASGAYNPYYPEHKEENGRINEELPDC